jgi:hypothetical protein
MIWYVVSIRTITKKMIWLLVAKRIGNSRNELWYLVIGKTVTREIEYNSS